MAVKIRRSRHLVLRDIQAAAVSKAAARWFHYRVSSITDRLSQLRYACVKAGLSPSDDKALKLLEYIVFWAMHTTSQFGTYASDAALAAKLGWSSADVVQRARKRLCRAGLLATHNARINYQGGKVPHYRLTDALVRGLRLAVESAETIGRRLARKLKALTSKKSSKRTAVPVHNPGTDPATPKAEKRVGQERGAGRSAIDDLKSLLKRTKVRCV